MVDKDLHNNGYIINESKEKTVYKISNKYPISLSFSLKYYKLKDSMSDISFKDFDNISDSIYEIYNELDEWGPTLAFSAFDNTTVKKIINDIPDIDLELSYSFALFSNINDIIGNNIIKNAQTNIEKCYNDIIKNRNNLNKIQANNIINKKFDEEINNIFLHINKHRSVVLSAIQVCYITLARDLQSYEIESNDYTPDKIFNFDELGPVEFYKGKYLSTYILTREKESNYE